MREALPKEHRSELQQRILVVKYQAAYWVRVEVAVTMTNLNHDREDPQ